MLAQLAARIDGHGTVSEIVAKLPPRTEPQDVFHALHCLTDWDLIVPQDIDPHTVVCWKQKGLARRFRPLIDLCEPYLKSLISIRPHDDFPLFCYAALPRLSYDSSNEESSALGPSGLYTLGAGFTRPEAILATLGELVETIGATWTDSAVITRATIKEAGDQGIHPNDLLLVSERQYENRNGWRLQCGARHRIPAPIPMDVPLDWVTAKAFPHENLVLVPAGYHYLNHRRDRKYLIADSNGLASAPTRSEAAVAGFLELIERDAVAIWWYNRICHSAVDPACFKDLQIDECLHWMMRHQRHFTALDLTHDFGLPVIAVLSTNRQNTDIAMGFGAHFDYQTAVKKAMREMLQLYALNKIIKRQVTSGGMDSLDGAAQTFFSWSQSDFVKSNAHMHPKGTIRSIQTTQPTTQSQDTKTLLQTCKDLCRQKDYSFILLDSTPPAFGAPVARVIVPGLRSMRVRFALGRLYQVPVDMNWRPRPLLEDDLFQFPIPV